ncbi:GTPase-associated system all-helical protein GASH [Ralstonia pseudosolanacearum]
MAVDQQHLGALYKKLGMGVSSELIGRRAAILDAFEDETTIERSVHLVATIFDLPMPNGDLDWFLGPFRTDEPGFAADGVDEEVKLLAAALTHTHLSGDAEDSRWLSLAIDAASFGGMRLCSGDPSLITYAQQRLPVHQSGPQLLPRPTHSTKIDIEATYKPAEAAGAQNQWAGAHVAVKKAIEDGIGYTERGLRNQANQLASLRGYVAQLEEQVQTQWWAIAGWCQSTQGFYAAQPISEVVVRAAIDLADLCEQSKAGPISAPSLLAMTISRDRKPAQARGGVTLKSIATATPLTWRQQWLNIDGNAVYSRLTPTLLALALATDSNDQPDWEAQFSRKVGLSLEAELSPLEMATQLFKEIMSIRGRT